MNFQDYSDYETRHRSTLSMLDAMIKEVLEHGYPKRGLLFLLGCGLVPELVEYDGIEVIHDSKVDCSYAVLGTETQIKEWLEL